MFVITNNFDEYWYWELIWAFLFQKFPSSYSPHHHQDNPDEVYLEMGVCPQHDILWGSLTAAEVCLKANNLKSHENED